MIIDNHAHVGWYRDGYHSPREIWMSELTAGVEEIAVSSTSTCAGQYGLVCKEMLELIELGGDKIHPILWVTPEIIKNNLFRTLLDRTDIRWQGIKLHYIANPEWLECEKLVQILIEQTNELSLPVLLHTGEFKSCHAKAFEPLIQQYNNTKFILAHGRPIMETVELMEAYSNVFVDTAFMPIYNIMILIKHNLQERILFGTDIPINLTFWDQPTSEYIKERIDDIRQIQEFDSSLFFCRCVYH